MEEASQTNKQLPWQPKDSKQWQKRLLSLPRSSSHRLRPSSPSSSSSSSHLLFFFVQSSPVLIIPSLAPLVSVSLSSSPYTSFLLLLLVPSSSSLIL